MRDLRPRPPLPVDAAEELRNRQAGIDADADPRSASDRAWAPARDAAWFRNGPFAVLRRIAGEGEPCMYCDSGEASDVEHFHPRSRYPERTFAWDNLLLACTPCNRHKGANFPTAEDGSPSLLDPTADPTWEHLRLPIEGPCHYAGRYHADAGEHDPRGEETVRVLALNRASLLSRRRRRRGDLCEWARHLERDLAAGKVERHDARVQLGDQLASPLQPDVAEYFLAGPGRNDEPFRSLFARLEAT